MADQQASSASRIVGNLWVGATPKIGQRVDRFNVIVLCAQELQPPSHAFPSLSLIRAPLNDDGSRMTDSERRTAAFAGKQVAHWLGKGKTVLCACAQGRNRSGLVAALAMQELGYSADRAIAAVKAARDRPGRPALENEDFIEFLFMRDGGGVSKRA